MGDGALAYGARSLGAGPVLMKCVEFCSGDAGVEMEHLAFHLVRHLSRWRFGAPDPLGSHYSLKNQIIVKTPPRANYVS